MKKEGGRERKREKKRKRGRGRGTRRVFSLFFRASGGKPKSSGEKKTEKRKKKERVVLFLPLIATRDERRRTEGKEEKGRGAVSTSSRNKPLPRLSGRDPKGRRGAGKRSEKKESMGQLLPLARVKEKKSAPRLLLIFPSFLSRDIVQKKKRFRKGGKRKGGGKRRRGGGEGVQLHQLLPYLSACKKRGIERARKKGKGKRVILPSFTFLHLSCLPHTKDKRRKEK